ncbi:hypothetical protein ACWOFR_06495 [Carnobacterium gallinarum]|uniref:hypothetical protein n=1 Tax=Carnobacterium gallinarum TaxID=2749 RepID=UPI000554FD0E|nr:hypothetical protein [Carnobacterium gallinarum]
MQNDLLFDSDEPITTLDIQDQVTVSDAISTKFGLNVSNLKEIDPLIPKTYKIRGSTAEKLENLVYKDKRKNKK